MRPHPKVSIERAAALYGHDKVVQWAVDLLSGRPAGDALDITLLGGSPDWTEYWFRVWGARALLYIWDDAACPAVLNGLEDQHWRFGRCAPKSVDVGNWQELRPHCIAWSNAWTVSWMKSSRGSLGASVQTLAVNPEPKRMEIAVSDSAEAVLHDGTRIRVAISGKGPALLIPARVDPRPVAEADTMRAWGADPDLGPNLVSGLSPSYRVIAADYEGHRMAHPAPETLTPANVAADFLAVADAAHADLFAGAPLAEHGRELAASGWDVQVLAGLDHLGAMQSSVVVPLLKTWLDSVEQRRK